MTPWTRGQSRALPGVNGRWIVQEFSQGPPIEDLLEDLSRNLASHSALDAFPAGSRIGIGVGSRGVTNVALVCRTVVDALHARELTPVVIPAMGSHGGATSEGQLQVLASYGVDETTMGCEFDASTATKELGLDSAGDPVHFSSAVVEGCDAIIPINRVKPHTDFRAPIESGLTKMIVIGFGKDSGAAATHRLGFGAFAQRLPERFSLIARQVAIPVGVALVENQRKQTESITLLSGDQFLLEEPSLLEQAWSSMATLPFESIDLLVIKQMGKDVSGGGCDPNVIGRYLTSGMSGGPTIQTVGCLSLTDSTHGNAVGIGMLDVVTDRLYGQIDFTKTYINALTARGPAYAKVPVVARSDADLVALGFDMAARSELDIAMAVIEDTARLERIWVTETLLENLKGDVLIATESSALQFDEQERIALPSS